MRFFIPYILILLSTSLFAKEVSVEQLFSVQTVKVKRVSSSHSKKNYGFIKANEKMVYDVSPRFGGYVVKLYADTIYKKVKKGEALATVYSPEVFKAKDEYLNSYRYSKSRKSKGMLNSAKLKLKLLGVKNSEIKNIISTKKVSQNTTIYSPIDGYIFTKNITNGSSFNAKQRLFKIINLDEVWVEAKIFEDDLVWLKSVEKFNISVKSNNKTYVTNNSFIYPNINPKEATLTLRLKIKNIDNKLLPGMYANIFSKDESKSYLTLPTTAVILKDNKYYAFIVGEYEGEYEPTEVDVEPLNNQTYIIKSGLNENDEVVNNALFMMDSDAQINGLY
jgi:Cu(I)/Ag(I) efflux system membrane fusion protein